MTIKSYLARNLPSLPIDEVLSDLMAALDSNNSAVLVASPGAGKTSRVPMALLDQAWLAGKKIIMLEPRRLAARSAASHMASLFGEQPGQTVGYRMRLDTKVSKDTRIEIVTDGVFVRTIMNDPELAGVGAVFFDEFHERNLDSDFALALALETQEALRPDLRILPMSATLDGAKVSSLLGGETKARVVESKGRSYPVSISYQSKNLSERIEDTMAMAVRNALKDHDGSILCFLPGQAEIHRTAERLTGLSSNIQICELYGSLDQGKQTKAISPPEKGIRKVVLATSIAETSITIDGVSVIIDSGLARVPRFEPSTGLSRLVTIKASKASIDQRAGRAGRTAPGTAIRLWHEGQTGSLPDYERPQILEADLTGLVLDLALWGVSDPLQMKWLDEPPQKSWQEAKVLLVLLNALNAQGQITETGKALRDFPLPPRLAHMVLEASKLGSENNTAFLALLLEERGLGGTSIDLAKRFEQAKREKSDRAIKLRKMVDGFARNPSARKLGEELSVGTSLSFAWPERIAAHMGTNAHGEALFKLVNGRRARLDGLSHLAKEKYIVACELQGSAASARILQAAAITSEEIQFHHGEHIKSERILNFDAKSERFQARQIQSLGELELVSYSVPLQSDDNIPNRLIEQLKRDGLGKLKFSNTVTSFRDRAVFLHQQLPDMFPDFSDEALEEDLENCLLPVIPNAKGYADISSQNLLDGFSLKLGYENTKRLSQLAPTSFTLPSGSTHSLHYQDNKIVLKAKVQEFFGMKIHPRLLDGKIPLTLEFLSPAMRPIQTSEDIAGFWKGSWAEVRRELRGRYPKHLWPEDPANAEATARAKPRVSKN
jgi:ATP-dependent helicase HrpB